MANTLLFLFRVIKFLCDKRLKSTDWIIRRLALTHLLMLGDVTCKSVAYLYRLMRGLSISATCLLSVLQALTLSPRSFPLAKFKPKSPQNIIGATSSDIYLQTWVFWDVLLIGLMALSSGYMVALLCRHKRQCQHLHSTSLSPRASSEQRATGTILVLLGFFMLMYSLDSMVFSLRTMWENDPVCPCIQMMVANGYATVIPLVFICTEKQSATFLKCLWQKNRQCLIIA
uniref:vomeronasal type-1 receptor 90-like n=1 Tax=Urocitellus parryii TaxID=9999 RepID=UPI000E55C4C9|nr:vomeronasal type-1 receptor 90-like [Urocitellus parryii]